MNYDFSTKNIQIGSRVNNTSPSTGAEVVYSRIGIPWWVDKREDGTTYELDFAHFTVYGVAPSISSLRDGSAPITLR